MKKMSIADIKEEGKEIGQKAREQTIAYIMAGLGLVAGLAWNDAIRSLIDYLFPLQKNTLLARFAYAVIITLVVVLVSRWMIRILGGKKKEETR